MSTDQRIGFICLGAIGEPMAANVAKEQVMVVVSRNRITVNVRPTSGVPLRPDAVLEAVRREVEEMGPWPMPEVRIQVSTAGVVGA